MPTYVVVWVVLPAVALLDADGLTLDARVVEGRGAEKAEGRDGSGLNQCRD